MQKSAILLIVILLVACGLQTTPEATNTWTPSNTPNSTETPQPTNTPELPTATFTLEPTITPAYEPGTIMVNQTDGAPMVYIPPGEFMIGNDTGQFDEKPSHLVFTDGFWIYQYEVTNAQYAQCMAAGECGETYHMEYVNDSQYANLPVIYVSWISAQKYCEWASGRLPTEAEWEKAARGGLEGMLYPWGNEEPVCDIGAENGAYFADCTQGLGELPIQGGSFAPNGYGVYDMAGNTREWVNDYYKEDYYDQLIYDNPQGPWGGKQTARGGGLRNSSEEITVTDRWWSLANYTEHTTGLRCAITP